MKTYSERCVRTRRCALVLALLTVVSATPGFGQDRTDTGRHKPVAPQRREQAAAPVAAPRFTDDGTRWLAGFGLGTIDGGDLFRVQTVSGSAVPWGSEGSPRFTASRFTAKVDPGGAVSAFVARRLGDGRWWLRSEFSRGASDIAAEALLGQGGEVFRFDRLTFLSAALTAEARLTTWPSHPFASAGLTLCRVTADLADGLDQTGVGFQASAGYRQRIGKASLALEAQLRRIAIDINEFRPSVAVGSQPELEYVPSDELWLMEIRLIGSRAW